jgi:hypothetical protein
VSSDIAMISPELTSGGVGDYTRRLLQYLPRISDLRLIVPDIGPRPLGTFEGYPVEEMKGTARDLYQRLPQNDGKVFVQYSAYGFSRYGYPRWLIKALLEWKRKSRGSLAVMFHEIWTFWPIWNRNQLLQQLHRHDIQRLVQVADAILTSTPDQAAHLTAFSPKSPVQLLPVGSNIDRFNDENGGVDLGLAVIFGSQPSRIWTLSRMHSDLKALGAAKVIRKIVTVGGGQTLAGNEEEFTHLMKLDLIDGFEQLGPSTEEKISKLLRTSEFGISGQDDRSVLKSSTLMAYAVHGLNIISCFADASKPEPLCLMVSPDELMQNVTEIELRARSERLRQWQERTSSWPQIAHEVARILEL